MNLFFTIFSLLFFIHTSEACTLKMGYRTTARLPNIEAKPSNNGVYQDLYREAAKRIGCKLEIHRMPKKRILRDLNRGTLDFYPGLTFTEKRSDTIMFFPNGLPSLDVGLTRINVPTINSYPKGEDTTILVAFGSSNDKKIKAQSGVKRPRELSFEIIIDYILDGKVDFYEDEIGTFAYYLKSNPRAGELRYHLNCCGGLQDLTVGFSRASPHLKEEINPHYDPQKILAYNNFPKRVAKDSTAYRFQQVLSKLKKEGYTDKVYKKYYGISINDLIEKK